MNFTKDLIEYMNGQTREVCKKDDLSSDYLMGLMHMKSIVLEFLAKIEIDINQK